ncbi:hypothetical protein [Algihabitans albus]|uniref:hypothetical protein n=1 Tax=Algihabitans albus TaxID=2164067 RepID=UPI001ABC9F35|nr:hypothetical protein [Algihabitans albus]
MREAAEIEIRAARLSDAAELAPRLRPADRREVMASHGHRPLQALIQSLRHSDLAWAGLIDGEVLALWGAGTTALLGRQGAPWLLAGRGLERHKRSFLRLSRENLARLQARYDYLENWVDARNTRSIRWLRWLGFTLEPAAPHGRFGRPFHRFWMRPDRMQNHV